LQRSLPPSHKVRTSKGPNRIAAFDGNLCKPVTELGGILVSLMDRAEKGTEPLYRKVFVAMLRAVIACDNREAGRDMDDPYGTFGPVLMLPAGTSGPQGLEAKVTGSDSRTFQRLR
jgi:hypothetical protein